MPRRHRNLFHTRRGREYDAAVAALNARIPTLQRHQIIVEMARIAAMVGDGHTNVAPTRDPKIAFRTYPVRLYLFKDGLYVRAADEAHADLVGARVLRIGNASADEAYAAAGKLVGRDNEWTSGSSLPCSSRCRKSSTRSAWSRTWRKPLSRSKRKGGAAPSCYRTQGPPICSRPTRIRAGCGRTAGSTRGDKDPLWLRDPKKVLVRVPAGVAWPFYVQFNQVGNKDDETIAASPGASRRSSTENAVDRFILDFRLNRGGNGGLNRPLIVALIRPESRRPGGLFVLIGRSTWSAAQMLVNELESTRDAVFVGEPTRRQDQSLR